MSNSELGRWALRTPRRARGRGRSAPSGCHGAKPLWWWRGNTSLVPLPPLAGSFALCNMYDGNVTPMSTIVDCLDARAARKPDAVLFTFHNSRGEEINGLERSRLGARPVGFDRLRRQGNGPGRSWHRRDFRVKSSPKTF